MRGCQYCSRALSCRMLSACQTFSGKCRFFGLELLEWVMSGSLYFSGEGCVFSSLYFQQKELCSCRRIFRLQQGSGFLSFLPFSFFHEAAGRPINQQDQPLLIDIVFQTARLSTCSSPSTSLSVRPNPTARQPCPILIIRASGIARHRFRSM